MGHHSQNNRNASGERNGYWSIPEIASRKPVVRRGDALEISGIWKVWLMFSVQGAVTFDRLCFSTGL
jgi:hypothetical protein